jgi:hypothetical protein
LFFYNFVVGADLVSARYRTGARPVPTEIYSSKTRINKSILKL